MKMSNYYLISYLSGRGSLHLAHIPKQTWRHGRRVVLDDLPEVGRKETWRRFRFRCIFLLPLFRGGGNAKFLRSSVIK